jgi:hypothetical protein
MLDNLEQLQAQLAQLQVELDAYEAAKEKERDRILAKFPKRDMLKNEVRRLNNDWMPYDSNRNFNAKDDLVSWIIEKTIVVPKELLEQYHETRERIRAFQVELAYAQWLVITHLSYSNYKIDIFWERELNYSGTTWTDGGLHYFSFLRGTDGIVYLEGRTPAAKDSTIYLAIRPDGSTYLVENIRYAEKKYDIGAIRYGKLEQI